MLTAIEPEIPAADRGVHKGAVMGLGRARVGLRPKVPAGDAHPLERNGAGDLQLPDETYVGEQQLFLGGGRQRRQRTCDLRGRLRDFGAKSATGRRWPYDRRSRIAGVGIAAHKTLANESAYGVCDARRGDGQMGGDVLRSQAGRPTGKEAKNLCLAGIQAGLACSRPKVSAKHEGDPVETFAQAHEQRVR